MTKSNGAVKLSENENFNYIKDSAFNGNRKKTNELLNSTIIERKNQFFTFNNK